MKLNDKMTFAEKEMAVGRLGQDLQKDLKGVLNRLFFAGKNGAIASLLRELEHYFQDLGFAAVRANWNEHMRGAAIEIIFTDKKKVQHPRTIHLKRHTVHAPEGVSPCMYSVESISSSDYYRVMPKFAVDIHEAMSSDTFKVLADRLVNGANYPFAYESSSGC